MDSQSITFRYESFAGKQLTRELNPIIDIRDFKGTPGFSLLALAAATQTHLSCDAVWWYLLYTSDEPGCAHAKRSSTWLQRRRRLFQQPGKSNLSNRDGKDFAAVQLMREYPEASLRDLVLLLQQHGIKRGREWCRFHRCDVLPTDRHSP